MTEKRDEAHMAALAGQFMDALEQRRAGAVDAATEALKKILSVEPRLAEPRLELASILLEAGQAEEAAAQAEEAISILESSGQWTDDLDENVLQSLAWSLVGESLQRQADHDQVVFGDPENWKELMARSKAAFKRAEALDPQNTHASDWAFGLELKPSDEAN